MACMLGWSWTLVRLYRDVVHSENLLPNKSVFKLHGSLLVAYLLLNILSQILTYWFNQLSFDSNGNLTLRGIDDLLQIFNVLLETLTFFLVVKMTLPITQSEKETRSKFQRFIFKGFADMEELKAAVFANNPEMTAEQR
jgi:hypothetical protein